MGSGLEVFAQTVGSLVFIVAITFMTSMTIVSFKDICYHYLCHQF